MSDKFRLLLAEDHETVRAGLKLLVDAQADMKVIGEAGDGETAVSQACRLAPDIVVMDVSLPKLNGLRATKRIKLNCPQTKILALTRHEDDGYLQQMLGAGANGYILKQSAPTEFINAIRAVGTGKSYLDQNLTGKVLSGYVRQSNAFEAASKVEISKREAEVLRLLALGNKRLEAMRARA